MIIEFNGLPGTGKTTVGKELNKVFLEKGYTCFFSYNIPKNIIARYISYIFDGSLYLYYLGLIFAKKLTGSFRKENLQIPLILVYFYQMYKNFQYYNPHKVLIIDQGIVQGIISIAHTDKMAEDKSLKKIFNFFSKKGISLYSVNCLCDVELSKERIRGRNTTGGRLDVVSDDELIKALDVQAENFDFIRNCANDLFKCVDIDTAISPELNAVKIFEFIEAEK